MKNYTIKKHKSSLKRLLPIISIIVISLILLSYNLYLTQKIRPFNSDDVSWQTILLSWRPFTHQIAYMGSKDNFLINAPLIFLLDLILGISRNTIFIQSLIFTIISFILVYFSCLYFLVKCKINIRYSTLLPFIWLASFGSNFNNLLLNPNWRVLEIGFSFIYFVFAMKLYYNEINPLITRYSKIAIIMFFVFTGFLIYSDNYFLYFTIVPIIVLYVALMLVKRINKNIVYLVIIGSAFSLIVASIIRAFVARIGLMTPGPLIEIPKLLTLNNVESNLHSAYVGFLYIFSATDFIKSNNMQWWSVLSRSLNLTVLLLLPLFLIFFLYRQHTNTKILKDNKTIQPRLFIGVLFIGIAIASFVAYFLVDGGNINSYRYLIITVFSIIILLIIGISTSKKTRSFIGILFIIASIFNIFNSYHQDTSAYKPLSTKPNSSNYKLISIIKKNHLTKGYANYWNGNINTYLSMNTINFLPVSCINGLTYEDNLLINQAVFHKQASRSFYIVEPSLSSPKSCSVQQISQQFGKPANTIYFSDKIILIYNYDLANRMPNA